MDFCTVMTTTAGQKQAEVLADILIERQLAACVQIMPIMSVYTWQGRVNREAECLMLIKTRSENYQRIEETIRANHDYEIPEIIQLPITAGFIDYLDWIAASTKPSID